MLYLKSCNQSSNLRNFVFQLSSLFQRQTLIHFFIHIFLKIKIDEDSSFLSSGHLFDWKNLGCGILIATLHIRAIPCLDRYRSQTSTLNKYNWIAQKTTLSRLWWRFSVFAVYWWFGWWYHDKIAFMLERLENMSELEELHWLRNRIHNFYFKWCREGFIISRWRLWRHARGTIPKYVNELKVIKHDSHVVFIEQVL